MAPDRGRSSSFFRPICGVGGVELEGERSKLPCLPAGLARDRQSPSSASVAVTGPLPGLSKPEPNFRPMLPPSLAGGFGRNLDPFVHVSSVSANPLDSKLEPKPRFFSSRSGGGNGPVLLALQSPFNSGRSGRSSTEGWNREPRRGPSSSSDVRSLLPNPDPRDPREGSAAGRGPSRRQLPAYLSSSKPPPNPARSRSLAMKGKGK